MILIVADNPGMRELLVRSLTHHEFQIATASDGGSGLLQFGLTQPDLVLLDVAGYEVLKRIRELSTVPVITFADLYDQNAKIQYLNNGADYCLDKPVGVAELRARIWALFRREKLPS